MSAPRVLVHPDAELLAEAVAARLADRLTAAIAARGSASVVLTGGGIGTKVLAELARGPNRDAIDWSRCDIWWGDERFLPEGDPERNETGARAALLDHVGVDPGRVHPMPGPDGPARARVRSTAGPCSWSFATTAISPLASRAIGCAIRSGVPPARRQVVRSAPLSASRGSSSSST